MALALVFSIGCASGYSPSAGNGPGKVSRAGGDGAGQLALKENGEPVVHDANDARAQAMLEAQSRQDAALAAQAERYERIKAAPKRTAGEPLLVALYEVELDAALTAAEHSDGAVFSQLRGEFEDDPVIVLVDPAECEEYERRTSFRETTTPPAADVEVLSRAYLKEIAGIDRKTGEPAKAAILVMEATIVSDYLESQHTVTEEGNLFENAEVTRSFAEKVKFVIKHDIGPMLPADRNI